MMVRVPPPPLGGMIREALSKLVTWQYGDKTHRKKSGHLKRSTEVITGQLQSQQVLRLLNY